MARRGYEEFEEQWREVVEALKKDGYTIVKRDVIMPLLEELKELREDRDAELSYYDKLGGLNAEELEFLSSYCRQESEVWAKVAEWEQRGGEANKSALRISRYLQRRGRLFAEWAAQEEHNFEQWEKENPSKARKAKGAREEEE